MARIAYHDMTDLPPELAAELAKRQPANIYRILAHGGGGGVGFLRLGSALRFEGSLDPIAIELVILRTGALSRAEYEIYHHKAIAKEAGMADDKILAAIEGDLDSPLFDAFEATLLRFTDEVVQDGKASEATFAALAEHYGPEELIQTTLLIGYYMTASRLIQTFDIDLDEHAGGQPKSA